MKKTGAKFSKKITQWIGSPQSLLVHTIFFMGIFALRVFGVSSSDVLLILTTILSIEAIYLAIFIQITVNQHADDLQEVSEDIEEIEKDIDEIQEDVEELEKEDAEEEKREKQEHDMMLRIEDNLGKLIEEVIELKSKRGGN